MADIKRFQKAENISSLHIFKQAQETIDGNLREMELLVMQVSAKKELFPTDDTNLLFYLGSCLYDFYTLLEECLLVIARVIDKWVPSSLDWHERLLTHLQKPIPEKRHPLLSAATASLLLDYLYFYLNFHRRCSNPAHAKVKIMSENLEQLYRKLERELTTFAEFLEMLQRARH
jgi:hypothetical protein